MANFALQTQEQQPLRLEAILASEGQGAVIVRQGDRTVAAVMLGPRGPERHIFGPVSAGRLEELLTLCGHLMGVSANPGQDALTENAGMLGDQIAEGGIE